MAIADLVTKANEPAFYTKVLFIAFDVAQDVANENPQTTNHNTRVAYANRILRGEENAPLLAAHVISSNSTIRSTIEAGNEPPDNDIEFALSGIWTTRAIAFS